MNHGHACCLLAVCCPAGSEKQRLALTEAFTKAHAAVGLAVDVATAAARAHADFVLDNFDLAPQGSLGPLTSVIAKIAREHP